MSVPEDNDVDTQGQNSNSTNQNGGENAAQVFVDCGSSLDISMVKNFSEQLKQSLSDGKPVVLDAENLEHADGAAMQLLYAFFHDAKANGVALSWKEPSAALKRSAALLGMSSHLGLS